MVPLATRVHIPKSISIGSVVFAGLTILTDTDRPCYSVTTGHEYVVL